MEEHKVLYNTAVFGPHEALEGSLREVGKGIVSRSKDGARGVPTIVQELSYVSSIQQLYKVTELRLSSQQLSNAVRRRRNDCIQSVNHSIFSHTGITGIDFCSINKCNLQRSREWHSASFSVV